MATSKKLNNTEEEEKVSSKTIILEENFRIDQGGAPGRYSLYVKKIISKGKSSEREDWDIVGYDFHMDVLLKKLTHILTDKKFPEAVTIKEYFKEYFKVSKYLTDLIKI
jgi:hypothetical protein